MILKIKQRYARDVKMECTIIYAVERRDADAQICIVTQQQQKPHGLTTKNRAMEREYKVIRRELTRKNATQQSSAVYKNVELLVSSFIRNTKVENNSVG